MFQLRHLQTFAAENNSTIIFPFLIEILSNFMNFGNNNVVNLPQSTASTLSTISATKPIKGMLNLEHLHIEDFNLVFIFTYDATNVKKYRFSLIQAPGTKAEDCSLKHLMGKEDLCTS